MKALRFEAAARLIRLSIVLFGCCVAGGAPAQNATRVVDAIDWERAQVDLSFLNASERPAGKHGYLHAKGADLVFDDGKIARFWGTNITAGTLFKSDRTAVKTHARRLSRLGFNLVRLHHHDSYWTSPNIFGTQSMSTRRLDPTMLDKLDWWIKCLKDEGIYVWLDLHVQRKLTAADGIDDFDEIAKGRAGVELKGFNYVNASIEAAMRAFNEAYLGHVNAYTDVALKDEPAIAAVLLTNENDLTEHYGNALLPNQDVPRHTARYLAQAQAFATAQRLPHDRVWRSWEPGVGKIFLNELEQQFNLRMITHLRSIGLKVPIVTTSWWGGEVSSLPALSSGDMVDVHAYEEAGVLERDPGESGNALHRIAVAQLTNMPLSVSEWNMSTFPAPDRIVQPLLVADMASRQGWDALMHYAYSQQPLQSPAEASNWEAFNDPSRLAMLPAAALLYRQGHVRQQALTYAWTPSIQELFEGSSSSTKVSLRLAAERGRLITVLPSVPALPWLKRAPVPSNSANLATSQSTFIEYGTVLASRTGESRRDWKSGVMSVDTPFTQALAGKIGAGVTSMSDVTIRLTNSQASVAVQSLDSQHIAHSSNILISVATPSAPSTSMKLPFVGEAVCGDVEIRSREGLVTESQKGVDTKYVNGRYIVHFEGNAAVHWVNLHSAGSRP